MKKSFFYLAAAMTLSVAFVGCQNKEEQNAGAAEANAAAEIIEPYSNKIKMTTSMGGFTLELLPEAAPATVENFQKRVREGFYDGLIFHRVKPNLLIQGGGHLPNMATRPHRHVKNLPHEGELAKEKGLTNTRGAIAMAYVPGDPFGAAVQFFINVKNNPDWNFKGKTSAADFGFTPFGKVIEGMDVVDKISKVRTNSSDAPLEPVIITKAEEIKK
jgi:cyclophilin family peptidyl-prolyl cis-trans isomerase